MMNNVYTTIQPVKMGDLLTAKMTTVQKNYFELLEEYSIQNDPIEFIVLATYYEIDNGQKRHYQKMVTSITGQLHYIEKLSYRVDNIKFNFSDIFQVIDGKIYVNENEQILDAIYNETDPEQMSILTDDIKNILNGDLGKMEQTNNDIVDQTFILAGKAEFTVHNAKTGNEFTYRATRNETDYNNPVWIKVKVGRDWLNCGVIFDEKCFRHYAKCKVSKNSPEFIAFNFIWNEIYMKNRSVPNCLTVKHTGRCGRCGRKLTVNQSIINGIGPVCAEKMGLK